MRQISITFDGNSLNRIPGFTVHEVIGKDGLSQVLTNLDIPGIPGVEVVGKKYKSREIKVRYTIEEPTEAGRKKARDDLAFLLLNRQNKQLIFSDESDRYFVATVTSFDQTNITFFCAKPFRYALESQTYPVNGNGLVNINNRGTREVPIHFSLKTFDENAYLGIVSDRSTSIMEFGEVSSPQYSSTKRKYNIIDTNSFMETFRTMTWDKVTDAPADKRHKLNVTAVIPDTGGARKQWLTLGSCIDTHGDINSIGWCGGSYELTIPKVPGDDFANDSAGSSEFEVYASSWFEAAGGGQLGEQVVQFFANVNGSEQPVIAFGLSKGSSNSLTAVHYFAVWDDNRKQMTMRFTNKFAANSGSEWASGSKGVWGITKSGAEIRYNGTQWHSPQSFYSNDLNGVRITKVKVIFNHMASSGAPWMTRNYIGDFIFCKHDAVANVHIPHEFPAGTTYEIDGQTGKVYVGRGGATPDYMPGYEVTGTQYIEAEVGMNNVQINTSTWCNRLKGTVTIREEWL